jgi:hypothetical protein
MQHAEDYCARAGCQVVDLRIVHLRGELLAYYGKRGYVECGTEPAEVVKGAKLPVHFILMSKALAPESESSENARARQAARSDVGESDTLPAGTVLAAIG